MKKMLIILLIVAPVLQISSQTIRPGHWLMDDVRYYWHRGEMWRLSPLLGPYTAQELSAAFQETGNQREPGLSFLKRTSAPEDAEKALAWLELDNALVREAERRTFHTVQRATFGAQFNPVVQMYGAFNIDNQLDADTTYMGERQSGYTAFMEQAYIQAVFGKFRAKFGRDYLVWGPGVDASLHLSDASRPMDHLYLSWQNRWLHLSWFTATLDKTEYPIDDEPSVQNRYLSGHRIEVRPRTFFRIGLAETALFGGPNAGIDFAFLNPVLFYTGVEQNGPQSANVMASLDATLLLWRRLTLYGGFLLDDIQFESKSVDDRGEPPEYGVMAGVNWADPLNIKGLDLFAEYTRVSNRTYNGQGGPWEKYLHRNKPIGHFLGNDFDRTLFGVGYRTPRLRCRAQYEHRRRGEGRIDKPFDAPWRDVPEGEEYAEPFPTGVVETSNIVQAACRWQPFYWLRNELIVSHYSMENRQNVSGVQKDYWDVRLNVSFEILTAVAVF